MARSLPARLAPIVEKHSASFGLCTLTCLPAPSTRSTSYQCGASRRSWGYLVRHCQNLYDLQWFVTQGSLDTSLVRRLWVLKVYRDVNAGHSATPATTTKSLRLSKISLLDTVDPSSSRTRQLGDGVCWWGQVKKLAAFGTPGLYLLRIADSARVARSPACAVTVDTEWSVPESLSTLRSTSTTPTPASWRCCNCG